MADDPIVADPPVMRPYRCSSQPGYVAIGQNAARESWGTAFMSVTLFLSPTQARVLAADLLVEADKAEAQS